MTVNSYLVNLASDAIVRDLEKLNINKSLEAIDKKIFNHFGSDVSARLVFGSYSRGTILPRFMDSHSDIDYMVVFNNKNYQPLTYIEQLRRFAEGSYQKSEVFKDGPTIGLELNHIRFDLVPAIPGYLSSYQIPAPSGAFLKWQDTNPTDFNGKLSKANQENNSLIKPLIRVVKYWNAKNGYIFESYLLEKKVVERGYYLLTLLGQAQLKSYFYDFMESLECGWSEAQWKREKIARMKKLIKDAKEFEGKGDDYNAEKKMKELLPPIGLQGLNALIR